MPEYTLTIPMIPASMNERERMHWARRKKELATICTELGYQMFETSIPRSKGDRRRVSVEIVKGKRSRVTDDPANLPSRAKSILDALTSLQLITDDNARWLDWGGVTERRDAQAAKGHTIITISTPEEQAA